MSIGTTIESGQVVAALSAATERLSARAEAVMVRQPPIDADVPDSSDIDLLALGAPDDFLPERLKIPGQRPIDVMWLPRAELDDLPHLAAKGLIPHRMLSSRILYDRSGFLTDRRAALARLFETPQVRAARIAGLMEMGFATVREVGVSWEAPHVALFWLHMAHAACLAALADGLGLLCPNVYTRPTGALRAVDRRLDGDESAGFAAALRLNVDPADLVARLRRMQAGLAARFPEPDWPPSMREMTRWEYRYFSAPDELEFRIRIARELARRGDRAGAVFYLRFHAYALARLPMIHARAREGRDDNFLRPSQRVGAAFAGLCPDLADDFALLLGGPALDRSDVEAALAHLQGFRARSLTHLAKHVPGLPELPPWQPFEAPAPPPGSNPSRKKETSHACPR